MYMKHNVICIHGCLCSGSSGFVRYDSLSPGTYTLRIVARAANGEREIERRKIHIGRYGVEAPFIQHVTASTPSQCLFRNCEYHIAGTFVGQNLFY